MSQNKIGAPRYPTLNCYQFLYIYFFGPKGVSREIIIGNKEIPYVKARLLYIYLELDICYANDIVQRALRECICVTRLL